MLPFYESQLEQAFIELLEESGWDYTPAAELGRADTRQVLLQDDLHAFLRRRYADLNLTPSEIARITAQLAHIPATPLYAGSKQVFRLLTEGLTLQRDNAALPAAHLYLLDFDGVQNNTFRAINQFNVVGSHKRIPDVLLFVNGIPVVMAELKSTIDEQVSVFDAWQQIHSRYRRDVPELLKYTLLSVISDGAVSKLGTVFTPFGFYYSWNRADDVQTTSNADNLATLVKGALCPARLLAILRDFIYYPDQSDNETVIACRYPQFFAANKIDLFPN